MCAGLSAVLCVCCGWLLEAKTKTYFIWESADHSRTGQGCWSDRKGKDGGYSALFERADASKAI